MSWMVEKGEDGGESSESDEDTLVVAAKHNDNMGEEEAIYTSREYSAITRDEITHPGWINSWESHVGCAIGSK